MAKRTEVPPRFEHMVKRLVLDIQEVDRHLVFAHLPQGVLESLSQAVDHLRATCWAVLNSVADEFSDGSRATVILTSHRIQRSTQLMGTLMDEMDAGHITRSTQGVERLRNEVGRVYKKLHYLTTGQPAPPDSAQS